MTRNAMTVAARLGGELLALDLDRARGLLSMAVPDAVQPGAQFTAGMQGITVEPGEGYAVLRGVAVMPLRGVLTSGDTIYSRYFGWATYQGIEAICDELAGQDDVTAVVLDIDSPGGMVRGIDAAGLAVARLAAVKPVHVLVNPLCASAAYWIAAQGASITMTPGAEVGSIGVAGMASQPVGPDMWGDQTFVFTSSHARAKRPDPTTDAGRAELQRFADEAEARFHAAIAAGRGIDAADLPALLSVSDDPADGGATYDYAGALARRLVDGQATRAAFYDDVFARHGLQPQRPQGARAVTGAGRRAQAAAAEAVARA